MPDIAINNLYSRYGRKKDDPYILKGLTTKFHRNNINAIIGQSGEGKTTLIKCIAGLIPYEGEIYFDETNLKYLSIRKRNIAYVSQNIILYPHMTIFNNIANPLTNMMISGNEIKERVYEVAKLFHIENILSRKPKEISIGQASRVSLARALIKRPYVYLLDEPFSNLDPLLAESLYYELKEIFKSLNATVILITHDIKESFLIGDIIYTLHDGIIVDSGTQEEIMVSEVTYTKELLKNAEL